MPGSTSYSWVEQLPDSAILEILEGLHDLCGHDLRSALLAERWKRHAIEINSWPLTTVELSPTSATGHIATIQYIDYCGAGVGSSQLSPNDPNHRPHQKLDYVFSCTCGWTSQSKRTRRYRVSPVWWPLADNHTDQFVCRSAQDVNDPYHAPRQIWYVEHIGDVVGACICGSVPHYLSLQKIPL